METQSEPKKRNWRGSVLRIVVLSTLIAGIGAPILWQQLAAYESEGGLASVPAVELPITAKLKENLLAHMAVDQPIVFSDYEQVYGDPPAAGLALITDPGLLSRRMVFGERTYVGAPLSTPWKTNNQFLIHRIVGDLWLFTEFSRKGTIEAVDLSKIEVRETAMDPYDIKTLRFDYRIVGHPELGD
ncbi:MAG: hypothetical protein SFY68_11120, partial [Candidatus Sumerlaeia bacterium]|nr:hypothetical protein [Candidatus Sumerlaeia bacterium]